MITDVKTMVIPPEMKSLLQNKVGKRTRSNLIAIKLFSTGIFHPVEVERAPLIMSVCSVCDFDNLFTLEDFRQSFLAITFTRL